MPREITIRFQEEVLPPRDPSHGTADAMLRRTLTFELPGGRATWEQTDCGHPGRLNPWDPRQIDSRLQADTERLRAIADAVPALADAS